MITVTAANGETFTFVPRALSSLCFHGCSWERTDDGVRYSLEKMPCPHTDIYGRERHIVGDTQIGKYRSVAEEYTVLKKAAYGWVADYAVTIDRSDVIDAARAVGARDAHMAHDEEEPWRQTFAVARLVDAVGRCRKDLRQLEFFYEHPERTPQHRHLIDREMRLRRLLAEGHHLTEADIDSALRAADATWQKDKVGRLAEWAATHIADTHIGSAASGTTEPEHLPIAS